MDILVSAGLPIYGFTLTYCTVWITPLLWYGHCMLRPPNCNNDLLHTLSTDTALRSSEVSQAFAPKELFLQEFGMTFAFHIIAMAKKTGYQLQVYFFGCWETFCMSFQF
jgi:hypothetical protein